MDTCFRRYQVVMRKAFLMSVNVGAESEYERRHNPVWDELAGVSKAHGVGNYSIFWNPDTLDLFAYAEIESEAQWTAIASTPVCQRWWKYVGDLMPHEERGAPIMSSLKEVFHLD